MPRGIGIFCTECRPESVHPAKPHGSGLRLKLSGNCQIGFSSKKILLVINSTIFGMWNMVQIKIGDLKHFAGTFRIRSGDNRGIDIIKLILVKKLMNSKTYLTAYPEYCPKKIGTETEVCLIAKHFQRVFFGLQNGFFELISKILSQNLYFSGNNFHALSCSLAFHHFTGYAE